MINSIILKRAQDQNTSSAATTTLIDGQTVQGHALGSDTRNQY
uniref:Uncharacterized protein n=1 Tax=Arundo donax TaxID=35708 RepID=A0A0A9AMZ8_ARUDO